jgi:hypothetical protein
MHSKIIFILIFSLCNIIFMRAQNDDSNAAKYWKYRQRLRTIFLKPGESEGCGNVDAVKALNPDRTKKYEEEASGFSLPATALYYKDNSKASLEWGDTPMHLGWY